MRRMDTRRIWGCVLWWGCMASLPAQEALPPWVNGMPGLEHAAAWGMGRATMTFGVQHAERWTQGDHAMSTQFVGAGWRLPSPHRRKQTTWSLGWSSMLDQPSAQWREGRHLLQAAASIPLDRVWVGSAGIGVGVQHWTLDGQGWSWDAQYGPAGHNADAPTGEPSEDLVGGRWSPEVQLSVGAERPSSNSSPMHMVGAVSLHHALRAARPHFLPVTADTASRRVSWWTDVQGALGADPVQWRATHRGSVQGGSALVEFSANAGRSFGSDSRHTKDSKSHQLEFGVLWRSDGLVRLPLTWTHGDFRCWLAPGIRSGHPSPAATGWALALVWSSAQWGSTPLVSR